MIQNIKPKKSITKEQHQMWTILADSYGDKAWKMLADITKGKKINYRKADRHFQFIMDNWPNDEVLRTVKTWLRNTPHVYHSEKLKTFNEFRERYGDLIVEYKWNGEPWPEPKSFDNI